MSQFYTVYVLFDDPKWGGPYIVDYNVTGSTGSEASDRGRELAEKCGGKMIFFAPGDRWQNEHHLSRLNHKLKLKLND